VHTRKTVKYKQTNDDDNDDNNNIIIITIIGKDMLSSLVQGVMSGKPNTLRKEKRI
jgi:hypothetical protein